MPRSWARKSGPKPVPYRDVARGPALQWVRMPSPGFTRESPYSEMARHMAISSRWMDSAASFIVSWMEDTSMQGAAAATETIRSSIWRRFTAVGREALR